MTASYKPGPWTAEAPNLDPGYGELEKDYWSIRAPGPQGCISHELAKLSGWSPENDEHTARLMAAAPELLEALEDMLSGWKYIRESHGDLYGVGWDRAQDKAEFAIAKAKGEQQ